MKKFTIFFLMVFMYLGNQARCETTVSAVGDDGYTCSFNSANSKTYIDYSSDPLMGATGMFACNFTGSGGVSTPRYHVDGIKATKAITVRIEGAAQACNGATVTLTDVIEDNEPADTINYEYQWFIDATPIVGETDSVYVFAVSSLADMRSEFICEVTKQFPGCSAVASPVFEFTKVPNSIVSITGAHYPCESLTTLTAVCQNEYISENPYQWIWYDGTIYTTTFVPTFEVSVDGNYTVEAVYRNSVCNATSPAFAVDFGTFAAPTITPNTTQTICADGSVQFIAAVTNNAEYGNPTSYIWKKDGQDFTTTTFNTLTVNEAGDYTVRAVYANGCVTADATQVTVTVSTAPQVVITGSQFYCGATADVALTANADMTCDFVWYRHDILPNLKTTASALTSPLSNTGVAASLNPYYYTVVVTNANGCVTTSAPYEVSVVENPTVTINASETTVCAGGEIMLTSYVGNILPENVNYNWMLAAVNVGTQPNLTLSNLTVGDYTYTLNVETMGGCIGTADITIHVVADPTLTVTPNTPTTLCSGSTIALGASITTGGVAGGEVYTWQRNGVTVYGATGNSFTDELTNTNINNIQYLYTATVEQAASGCAATANSAAVTVLAAPAVSISGNSVGCSGTNVSLTANVPTGATYIWFLDGVNVGNDAPYSASHTERTAPYVFTLQVTSGGCTMVSEPYNVYVNAAPTVAVTVDDATICVGGVATLTANLGDWNSPELTYTWSEEGTVIAGATGLSYTTPNLAAGNHTYTFNVTQTTSGCTAQGTATVTVTDDQVVTSITVDSYTICEGEQVSVTATATQRVTDALVYTWYRNGVEIEGVHGASFTETPVVIDNDEQTYVYSAMVSQVSSGCTSSILVDDATLTVRRNPSVTISADPIICNGTNVALTANVNDTVNAVGTYTYQWRLFNANISGATSSTLNESRANTDNPYIYTVLVSNENGCSRESEAYAVYVNDQIFVEVTATEDSICAGGEVTLTANIGDYNDPNLIYRWYTVNAGVETEILGATQATVVVNPTNTTDYRVRVLQTTSLCEAVGDINVKVITAPDVTLSLTPDDTICDGGQVTLTATVVGDGTYAWYENGTLIVGATQNVYRVSPITVDNNITSYNYAVIFTPNIEGCVSATVDTIVTVYANPSVEITGDPIICDGTDVTLMANLNDSVINTTYTYQWMLANSDIAGATNRTLTQSQPATDNAYIYTVRVTNNVTGCVSVSAPFSVNVNEAPIVHITANETTVCSNGDVVMTAHLNDNNADNITYQWYRGAVDAANLIAGATNATYQTDALIATTEFFVVVSQTTSDCAVTNSITINVVDIPVISDIVMSDEVVCEGAQVTYTASATNGVAGDAYIYTWFRNGELVEGATGNSIAVPAVILDNETNFGVYSATVRQASSGFNSELFIADTLFIRPNPSVEISGDAIICHNGVVNLTANLNDTTNAVGTYSYQWRLFNSDLIAATLPTYSNMYASNDNPYIFTVVVTNENGCSTDSDPFYVYVNDTILVEVTSSEDSICAGGEVTLTANIGDYNAPNLVYRWYTVD